MEFVFSQFRMLIHKYLKGRLGNESYTDTDVPFTVPNNPESKMPTP